MTRFRQAKLAVPEAPPDLGEEELDTTQSVKWREPKGSRSEAKRTCFIFYPSAAFKLCHLDSFQHWSVLRSTLHMREANAQPFNCRTQLCLNRVPHLRLIQHSKLGFCHKFYEALCFFGGISTAKSLRKHELMQNFEEQKCKYSYAACGICGNAKGMRLNRSWLPSLQALPFCPSTPFKWQSFVKAKRNSIVIGSKLG